jgi:hypothetical protein
MSWLVAALLSGHVPVAAQHALVSGGPYDPAVPTPRSVLGYEVGERFTPHHLLMRYVERVAAASPRVRVDTVAHSFEGREVLLIAVTSEGNQRRLEEIRADAQLIADPRGRSSAELAAAVARMPTITWLGFTVHGPEASGAEAAIALLYQLAAGNDAETRMVLDSVVVLIDPLQNPDGHERHAQDVMRMRTALGVPTDPYARIHSGTWPGPRTSHYHFDLNRDWYAMSHPETRGRVASMLRWWPHVAADLHEMSPNATYFFPPAMAPINALVHKDIQRWWDIFAAGTISAFDERGWAYFRREGYDEFYPGYGSSWPLYSGAVGMTYEQASSRGGAIRRSDGTVLTLQQAARQHYTAAWATVTTAARHARERVRGYLAYRQGAIADGAKAPLRAVVFERDAQGRADSLASRLRDNGIEVKRLRDAVDVRGATLHGEAKPGSARLPAGAYVVDFAQPQGVLARALLEPDAPLDSAFIAEELERRRVGMSERFYDLTAWSLPFTFRVRAWGVASLPAGIEPLPAAAPAPADLPRARSVYAFAPGSEASIRLLAGLLTDSVRVRFAQRPFRVGTDRFPRGAFIVGVAANDSGVHEVVRRRAAEAGARVVALASAAVDEGVDLGSNSVIPVRAPRVALLGGAPIYGQSFGYAWYALDQRLGYPHTTLDVDALASALDGYDVLIVPSVSPAALDRALGSGGRARIAAWVRRGGTLIAIDRASEWITADDALSRFRLRRDSTGSDSAGAAPLPAEVPGAMARAIGDTLSPLFAGIEEREFPVLVASDRIFRAPRNVRPGEIVLRYSERPRLRMAGYFWPEVPDRLAGTPYLWTERMGNGRLISFAGDPNFRDLLRGQFPLFANAVLLGTSY